MSHLDESKLIAKRIKKRYDVNKLNDVLKMGRMEENSFLDPVTSEASRTTKSVPRRGFTSISRIAKG